MFDILAWYLKVARGIIIGRVRGCPENMDVSAQKELGGEVSYPECLSGWLLRTDDVVVTVNQRLSDCELMGYFRISYIVSHYKFKNDITQIPTTVDFTKRRNNSADYLNLREAILVYLRDIDRIPGKKLAQIGGITHRPMIILGNRRNENDATTKVKMPIKGHLRGKISGLEELTISLTMKKRIKVGILKKILIIINIRGAPFKSGL